ncbi:hypothetical protein EW146_g9694, partial [Bondarzewia mesenterica]
MTVQAQEKARIVTVTVTSQIADPSSLVDRSLTSSETTDIFMCRPLVPRHHRLPAIDLHPLQPKLQIPAPSYIPSPLHHLNI